MVAGRASAGEAGAIVVGLVVDAWSEDGRRVGGAVEGADLLMEEVGGGVDGEVPGAIRVERRAQAEPEQAAPDLGVAPEARAGAEVRLRRHAFLAVGTEQGEVPGRAGRAAVLEAQKERGLLEVAARRCRDGP